jgi:hypothetical protein
MRKQCDVIHGFDVSSFQFVTASLNTTVLFSCLAAVSIGICVGQRGTGSGFLRSQLPFHRLPINRPIVDFTVSILTTSLNNSSYVKVSHHNGNCKYHLLVTFKKRPLWAVHLTSDADKKHNCVLKH